MENFHKKNGKRKRRWVISTLIVIIAFLVGMFSGALYYIEKLFPIPQLMPLIYNKGFTDCPTTVVRKLEDLQDISKFDQIDKIFWGDSVVEGMHDSRFYGISNYQEVAQGGQIVYCALQEMDYLLSLNPDTVMIYLGGNDADGKSWYGPKEAGRYYEEIVDLLLSQDIQPIIHLIHGASLSRNRDYLMQYNKILEDIAKKNNILVVPNVPELSFDVTRDKIQNSVVTKDGVLKNGNLYTYDGEHLKAEGYRLWIPHIGQYVPDFLSE